MSHVLVKGVLLEYATTTDAVKDVFCSGYHVELKGSIPTCGNRGGRNRFTNRGRQGWGMQSSSGQILEMIGEVFRIEITKAPRKTPASCFDVDDLFGDSWLVGSALDST
jgi:hypothetical protein